MGRLIEEQARGHDAGRRWWAVPLLALAIGAAGTAAYVLWNGEDAAEVKHLDNGMPVVAGALRGPRTPLGSGLEVAEGSWLIGGIVPFEDHPAHLRGWRAVVAVEASGRGVFDDYARQADDLGIKLATNGSTCRVEDEALVCAERGAGGADQNLSVAIELRQGPAAGPVPPQSTLTIEVYESKPGSAPPATERGIVPQSPGEEGRVPVTWPPLPDSGEPFWSFRNEIRGGPEDFRVPGGSRILAHSSLVEQNGVSWTMFEVTGEVDDVMRQLQAEDHGDACPIERVEQSEGTQLWWSCWTGSGSHEMFAVERPGEPIWLLLETNPLT